MPSERVCVVAPVRDEPPEALQALIGRLRAALQQAGSSWELLLVDDGSQAPATLAALAACAAQPQVRVLRCARPDGQEAAVLAGLFAARTDCVCVLDADLENPPEAVPALLERLRAHDAVFACRRPREVRWERRLVSRLYNQLMGWRWGVPLRDWGCGMFALRAPVIERMQQALAEGRRGPLKRFMVRAASGGWAQMDVASSRRPFGRTRYSVRRFAKIAAQMLTRGNTLPRSAR